ncbi:hypothetical protein ABT297_16090 [Dactylosporangium sp. NPDC000555]|uniref:hypothetical protein n=1 Tax=Dactylosporangium sp. NPDC000555 TaxID=3154260 RepID=UPI003323AD49
MRDTVARQPYAATVESIGRSVDRVEELSDWHDDVAFRYAVQIGNERWMVLLSIVGPVACVHRAARDGELYLKAADFVTEAPAGNARLGVVISIIKASGFLILNAEQVAQEMMFNPVNDVGPCPVFRVFFSDLEDVPWSE